MIEPLYDSTPKRLRRYYRSNQDILCGKLFFTTNGGRTWTLATTYWYKPTEVGRTYAAIDSCVDTTHPGPPYRSGGPLGVLHFSDEPQLRSSGTYYGWLSSTIGYRYEGGFVSTAKPVSFNLLHSHAAVWGQSAPSGTIGSWGDISSYGATGWKRFRPGNPTADLGVFLGEFKDVPRMLKGTAKVFSDLWKGMGGSKTNFGPRRIADQWLNTQFGWLPFISDLRKFYKTFVTLSDRLGRIKANNGRWQTRHGTVLMDRNTVEVGRSETSNLLYPALPTYFYTSSTRFGSYSLHLTSSRHVWFEGRFRYWIPDIGTPEWERRAVLQLFGALPNPALIWELTPWSWLVDYFSNVGDVVANMSSGFAENLAAKYAFIMGTTEWVGTAHNAIYLKSGDHHASDDYRIVYKHRVGASPFGFGLTGADLSVRQWSILAALGISKLRV